MSTQEQLDSLTTFADAIGDAIDKWNDDPTGDFCLADAVTAAYDALIARAR
jgi:hypothetical protein